MRVRLPHSSLPFFSCLETTTSFLLTLQDDIGQRFFDHRYIRSATCECSAGVLCALPLLGNAISPFPGQRISGTSPAIFELPFRWFFLSPTQSIFLFPPLLVCELRFALFFFATSEGHIGAVFFRYVPLISAKGVVQLSSGKLLFPPSCKMDA